MELPHSGPDAIFDVLTNHSEQRPDAPFLIFESDDGSTLVRSFAEMRIRAASTAFDLLDRGLATGDRIHVHLPNCPEFFDWWFGAAAIGAVIVPTNPLLTAGELAYVVGHSGCRLSVTSSDLAAALASSQPADRIVRAGEADPILPSERPLPKVDPLDLAAVLYTSGTTSEPKGVLVTHANYLHAGQVVAQHLRVRQDDRWLVVLPLFHANAQYYSTMSALVTGASLAVTSRFSASRWSRQATRHSATLASLFAAPMRMLLAQPGRADDAENGLRAVIFSQNLTESQLEEFESRFDTPLLQLYGMTETIAPPLVNPLHGDRRNMSVGRPTLGARLRVVDDSGRDCAVGETGELLVYGEPGSTLMAGYLSDEEATSAAIRDGWLHTGDNVRVDSDGYVYFVDRSKDMIKRAGENVAASEIEAVVNAHPAVFESAAVGVPDDLRDEAIKLFVVTKGGAIVSGDEILSWCRERLAKFKVPGGVEFVEALPRTSVGKIRKEVLRNMETHHSVG
jgi:crotonobetaine/carnitine-CoA ligase